MRPLRNCGTPIENSVEHCEECAKLDLPTEAKRAASFNQDYRQRRRDEASAKLNSGESDHEHEVEPITNRLILVGVMATPLLLVLAIAVLAGLTYGVHGFFMATAVESVSILVFLGVIQADHWGSPALFQWPLFVLAISVMALVFMFQ